MGFPFILKRTPGTTFPWDKNDWYRKNGYSMPVDSYLIMQWACFFILDIGFFCFIAHFLTIYENITIEPTIEISFEKLNQAVNQVNVFYISPFSTWSCKIMACFTTLVKLLSVTTSMIETEDPVVTKQRNCTTRSQTYIRRYGVPVIDSYSGICNICRIKVSETTRHCKLCNKCIDRMDHHCKWLNCCVGKSNYRIFLALVSTAFCALLWYSYMTLYVTWSCFYNKNVFMVHAFQIFELKEQGTNINRIYYISASITVFISLIVIASFIAITRLLIFHIKLAMLNLTTIQYLNLPVRTNGYSNTLFDSDDDDFYYSDSEFSDENHNTVRRRSLKIHPQWFGYPLYRKVTHKIRRTWISIMRIFIPNYKYRRLNNSKKDCNCCLFSFKRSHLLPMTSRKKQRNKRDISRFDTRDDVNMEEFFATKTIRPVITMDGEEVDRHGPDYDDDMGLDFTALDNFSEEEEDSTTVKKESNQRVSSKAARILDLPEEEIQHQQQRFVTIETPKEETALYEL